MEETSKNNETAQLGIGAIRRMYAKKIRKVNGIISTASILKREKRKLLNAMLYMHEDGRAQKLDYFWDMKITPFFAYYA